MGLASDHSTLRLLFRYNTTIIIGHDAFLGEKVDLGLSFDIIEKRRNIFAILND